jgi:hypothetical protein
MPPKADMTLWAAFTVFPRQPGELSDLVQCKYCGKEKVAANASRMRIHLERCKAYINHPSTVSDNIVMDIKRRSQSLTPSPFRSGTPPSFGSGSSTASTPTPTPLLMQSVLHYPKFSKADQEEADELAAMAIYCTGSKVSLFESDRWRQFLFKLNPAFRVTPRALISGALLTQAYEKMKQEVMSLMQSSGCINFVTDDSDNINQQRITNLSASIDGTSFYLCNEDIPGVKHDTQLLASWMRDRMLYYCGGQPLRINSYATDTENKMRAVYTILSSSDYFKHVFWIPCNSHGLQLLMRNIAKLPWFAEVFETASAVVNYFHRSNKQVTMLRHHQMREYKRHYSITLSVITRWGTQVSMLCKAPNFN